jgi:hypothetical protein
MLLKNLLGFRNGRLSGWREDCFWRACAVGRAPMPAAYFRRIADRPGKRIEKQCRSKKNYRCRVLHCGFRKKW